jgi:hypothetical protein
MAAKLYLKAARARFCPSSPKSPNTCDLCAKIMGYHRESKNGSGKDGK